MEWESRIREAQYTSPSEKSIVFLYGNISKETDLKTGLFTFPDKDGARVQHQGTGAVSFPLTCIFNGSDCMEKADMFEAMLFEKGIGELQHPVYGVHKVVPHGKIKRVDDLITGLNDSVVEVTFIKVISDDFLPVLEAVEVSEVEKMYEEFSDSSCEDFAYGIVCENIDDELRQKSILNTLAENVSGNLETLMMPRREALSEFQSTVAELKSQINKISGTGGGIVNGMLNTARFTLNLMRYPSRVVINISEKVKGYSALISTLLQQFKNDPFGRRNIVNSVMTSRFSLHAAVASLASGAALQSASQNKDDLSVQDGQDIYVPSREDALNAAVLIINLFEVIKEFDDGKVKLNSFVDHNGGSYFLLSELVRKSVRLILNNAFALPMQRTIVLDRDRQLIELSAELYGSADYADSLILDNKLTADEIVLLPMGKEITYYVKSA